MRFILRLAATAFLVAIGIGGLSSASAADRSARNEVAARQKIRAELTAAMANGRLTRMDQYRILLHAKEILTPEDFRGFERTLDRIAANPNGDRPAARPIKAEVALDESPDDDTSKVIASHFQESKAVEPLKAKEARVSSQSPFVEEIPVGTPEQGMSNGNREAEMGGAPCENCGSCDDCQTCSDCCRFRRINFDFFTAVDGFKGPLDVGNANGNFGTRLGLNSAIAILPRLGVGLQVGVAEELSNLKGSPYPLPNSQIRSQLFTTVGMFQRIRFGEEDQRSIGWGFAYDWLFDDYYSNFTFGQWRAKLAVEFNACNEIGVWAAVPERGATGQIFDIAGLTDNLHFKPIAQGCVYWKHTWCNEASVTGRFGLAERPGEFVFGTESRMPVTERLALTGGVTYIMPQASGGPVAQTQEIWNVSVGMEFVPGGFHRGCASGFRPFLPVADNGSLAVRELGP